MLKVFKKETLGKADYGWLKPRYHFSFAQYYNKEKLGFGPLRVLNDDLISPHTGFETHPHNDMEIVTYVIQGELTHTDSMGNARVVKRGEVQYMSAGTGVTHSEFNHSSEVLRLIQIWIYPDEKNLIPQYGDKQFTLKDRHNQFLHIVSGLNGQGHIKINKDANIFVTELDKGNKANLDIEEYQLFYIVQLEGSSRINQEIIEEGDAIVTDESIHLHVLSNAHLLLIQLHQ